MAIFGKKKQQNTQKPAAQTAPSTSATPAPEQPWYITQGIEAELMWVPRIDIWQVTQHEMYRQPDDIYFTCPELDGTTFELDEDAFGEKLDAMHALDDAMDDELLRIQQAQNTLREAIEAEEAEFGGPALRLRR